jgi:hypothetical protein
MEHRGHPFSELRDRQSIGYCGNFGHWGLFLNAVNNIWPVPIFYVDGNKSYKEMIKIIERKMLPCKQLGLWGKPKWEIKHHKI